MKLYLVTGLAVIGLAALSGCSGHQSAPEPTPGNIINGTRTQVIQMPPGFRNVAFTCYGTTGVYVASRGIGTETAVSSGLAVVAADPKCRG